MEEDINRKRQVGAAAQAGQRRKHALSRTYAPNCLHSGARRRRVRAQTHTETHTNAHTRRHTAILDAVVRVSDVVRGKHARALVCLWVPHRERVCPAGPRGLGRAPEVSSVVPGDRILVRGGTVECRMAVPLERVACAAFRIGSVPHLRCLPTRIVSTMRTRAQHTHRAVARAMCVPRDVRVCKYTQRKCTGHTECSSDTLSCIKSENMVLHTRQAPGQRKSRVAALQVRRCTCASGALLARGH
jgi:hypothetical protein